MVSAFFMVVSEEVRARITVPESFTTRESVFCAEANSEQERMQKIRKHLIMLYLIGRNPDLFQDFIQILDGIVFDRNTSLAFFVMTDFYPGTEMGS